MWICVPTTDDRGLSSPLSAHFGRAPHFTFIERATGRTWTVANPTARHEHGGCRPLEAFSDRVPDALLCRGIGRRAFERFSALGVDVYLVDEPDVERALRAFEEDRAEAVTPASACRGGHYDAVQRA